MTIASTISRMDYLGNNTTDTYSYTFKIFTKNDLRVTKKNTSGTETVLTVDTDYTVTGVGSSSGGTIVLSDGDLPTGYTLTIRRVRQLIQDTDIRNQGDFFPEGIENAFDHVVMITQQQQDEIDRSVKNPESVSNTAFSPTLPTNITSGGGRALSINDTGNGFELGPTSTEVAQYQAAANAAPPWFNILDFGSGTKTGATISSAMTALEDSGSLGTGAKYSLLIKRGSWTISSNLTIPSNVHFIFEQGAVLNIANGVTFTYYGPDIQAPLNQIFSLTGTGKFVFAGQSTRVYPQYWGAKGDGVNDDAPAVLAAAKSLNNGGAVCFSSVPVSFAMGPTYFQDLDNVSFVGEGGRIISRQPGSGAYGPLHFVNCSDFEITGLEIDGRYPYWATQPVHSNYNNFNIVLEDCVRVRVHKNFLRDSGYNTGMFDKFGDGIYVTGTSAATCNHISVFNNRFLDDGRWSVAVLCGSDISITNNVANRSSASSTALGFIDFEYNPGVGDGKNITVSGNKCNGASEIVYSINSPDFYYNVSIQNNTLSGFYDNGAQRETSAYSLGVGVSRIKNLTISNNIFYGIADTSIQLGNVYDFAVVGNEIKGDDGTYYGLVGIYGNTITNGIIASNNIVTNSGTGYGMQLVTCAGITVLGNFIKNPANVGLLLSGDGLSNTNYVLNNNIFAGSGVAFDMGGSPLTVMGNTANTSGRLSKLAHLVANNAMTISTVGGTWYYGGGRYVAPDTSLSRSMVWLSAAPTDGTWARGDIVWNSSPSAGGVPGWVCVTAGSGGTAVFKEMASLKA